MRDLRPENLTEVFMDYLGDDVEPRTREIVGSLVKHLHDFARETQLTHDEWRRGIAFLEACGEISDAERHEFVLLSDVLGLSSLVDMLHSSPEGTSSSVLGPFHITGAPPLALGGDLRGELQDTLLLVEGHISSPSGEPIEHATLDIWQTAPNGLYSSQDPEQDTYSFHGLQTADADGGYRFTTVKPVPYTVPSDGPVGDILRSCDRHPWRPSHLHFIVSAPGYRSLVTEVFPDDDPYLDQDTVFGVRKDLIMRYERRSPERFPGEGYVLSGQVSEPFDHVEFNMVLAPQA
ncbi:MAG: dioxygenase [Pseudomonadota bacterium]